MKQTERLKHIYLQLNEVPQTIESLQLYFKNLDVTVSNRQLYRDLADVNTTFLRSGEVLEQRTAENNRKIWIIQKIRMHKPSKTLILILI